METHKPDTGYTLTSKNKVVNKKGYTLSSQRLVTTKGGCIHDSKKQHTKEPSIKVKSKKEKRAELYLILATLLFIGLFFFIWYKIFEYRSEIYLSRGEVALRIWILIFLFVCSFGLLRYCKMKAMLSDIPPYNEGKKG